MSVLPYPPAKHRRTVSEGVLEVHSQGQGDHLQGVSGGLRN
jgi:hypothetical protein